MNDEAIKIITCDAWNVAAYLDGEMSVSASNLFEQHAKECAECADALAMQRRLVLALGAAFGNQRKEIPMPTDFTRIVTAHAQTDMRGLRRKTERRRALLLCAIVGATAFVLLGATMFDAVLTPSLAVVRGLFVIVSLIAHSLADAATGATVILRAVGGRFQAHPAEIAFLFALAIALLLLSIASRRQRLRLPQ